MAVVVAENEGTEFQFGGDRCCRGECGYRAVLVVKVIRYEDRRIALLLGVARRVEPTHPFDRRVELKAEAKGLSHRRSLCAASSEEVAQKRGAFVGSYPVAYLELVVESRIAAEVVQRPAGTRFGVRCAVDDPGDPGLLQRTSAHGARLKGGYDGGTFEPPGVEDPGGVLHGQQLCMGNWVVCCFSFVVAAGDDPAVYNHQGADRHISVFGCLASFVDERSPSGLRQSGSSRSPRAQSPAYQS